MVLSKITGLIFNPAEEIGFGVEFLDFEMLEAVEDALVTGVGLVPLPTACLFDDSVGLKKEVRVCAGRFGGIFLWLGLFYRLILIQILNKTDMMMLKKKKVTIIMLRAKSKQSKENMKIFNDHTNDM